MALTLSPYNYAAQLVELIPSFACSVRRGMAFTAKQLEVIKVQNNLGLVNVLWRYVYLVMHNLTGDITPSFKTRLTKAANARRICRSAILPRLGFIKSLCKVFQRRNLREPDLTCYCSITLWSVEIIILLESRHYS